MEFNTSILSVDVDSKRIAACWMSRVKLWLFIVSIARRVAMLLMMTYGCRHADDEAAKSIDESKEVLAESQVGPLRRTDVEETDNRSARRLPS